MIKISSQPFSTTKDGREVVRCTMENDSGMKVSVLSYGCVIQSIIVPGRNGTPTDVVLGYDTLQDYEAGTVFLGAFVGRYANRIKKAEFTLNGKTYQLEKNDGNNHLHGIWCRQVFDWKIDGDSVVFSTLSPAFDEGYPGNVTVEVRYTLTEDNALQIAYKAETDEDTVINLTNHSYFNLNGADGSDVLDQIIQISADTVTEADEEILPNGNIMSVEGTPLDFRSPQRIGAEIDSEDELIKACGGFDHNFILRGDDGIFKEAAKACSEKTGIAVTCSTTQPAMQFYSGNFLGSDAEPAGKNGVRYPKRGGFCLETQHYPCSPNFPQFPTTVLKKGDTYKSETVYSFSAG